MNAIKLPVLIVFVFFSFSFSQKVISYKKKGIEGVIFTKEYFKNNSQNFTPKISDIDNIESLIKKSEENFSNYYRQYIGHIISEKEIIVQLFPKSRSEKEYKDWKKNYIYAQDDINIRYAYYNLKTKKLEVLPKEKFSG